MKPLIGITANLIKDDQFGVAAHIGGPGQRWQALANDYIEAVSAAGGIPVILPVISKAEGAQDISEMQDAKEYISRLDGILFSGGCDISPLCYGQDVISQIGEICQERDSQELALMRSALELPDFPILGICRGCQLLNVALGGSLVDDIDTAASGNHFFPAQRMSVPTHRLQVREGSMIDGILGEENRVNSYHHQCIRDTGSGAKVTATDSHGVAECIEVPVSGRFILGVQWHPEGLAREYEGHANIFKTFVHEACEYKKGGRHGRD